MPRLDVEDMGKLAFPDGMRQRYGVLAWEHQRIHFIALLVVGALLFLAGGFL